MDLANPVKLSQQDPRNNPFLNRKPITPQELRAFGLDTNRSSLRIVENFEELRKNPPNMVIAEAKARIKYVQNRFKIQEFKKRFKYVMSLGVYHQLKFDPYKQRKILVPATMKFSKIYKPYLGQDLSEKTLIIWRTGGIGDLLFIQPSLRYLKKQYPDCWIKFSCGPQYQSLVDNWDCIDELLDLPFNVKHLFESDYHATFEGVIERCKQAHDICSYVLFAQWLGLRVPPNQLRPILKTKPDKVEEVKKVLHHWGIAPKNFIVVQIRASSPIRTPSLKFWKEVVDYLHSKGHFTIVTDTPRMKQWLDEFISTLKDPKMCMNFSEHSKTLDCSIALISLAKMVVSTDSSMCHISGALDIPVYGIYGPFPGRIRLSTFRRSMWIDAPSKCSPCYIHGHTPCPHSLKDGSGSCFMNINVPETMDQALEFLKKCEEEDEIQIKNSKA